MATDGHPQPSSPAASSATAAASPITAWLATLSTSLIAAVWVLSSLFAYVAAIFGEHAPDYIPAALGFSCVAAVVVSIVVTFTTRSGLLAYPQDSPVSIAALVSGAAAAAIAVGDFADPQRSVFLTTLLFLAISSLLTGVAFWLLGRYNLGNVIRFIPYPVIGGFLAAIGWLLLKISLTTMTGEQFALAQPVCRTCSQSGTYGFLASSCQWPCLLPHGDSAASSPSRPFSSEESLFFILCSKRVARRSMPLVKCVGCYLPFLQACY